jgi:hypothetical protein
LVTPLGGRAGARRATGAAARRAPWLLRWARRQIPTTFYARNGESNQLYRNRGDGATWPRSGATEVFRQVAADRIYRLTEGTGRLETYAPAPPAP